MKENKIEKLILDLSNRWECTPQEAVDRLNSMNESEINKLIKDMVKKFSNGGFIDCLRNGGTVSKCKCGKRIGMQQDGGRITRKDALETAMDQMGYSRSQARLAYQNQKNALRNQGFRGAEMRQAARANMMNSQTPGATPMPPLPTLYDNIDIEIADDPILNDDEFFTPLDSSIPTVQKIDRFGGNYNSAFAAARRSGLDKFYWIDPTGKNSGWKTTELAATKPTSTKPTSTQTPAQDGLQIVESSGSTAPMVIATPVDDGKGGQRYRFRDLLKMAVINGAANMK